MEPVVLMTTLAVVVTAFALEHDSSGGSSPSEDRKSHLAFESFLDELLSRKNTYVDDEDLTQAFPEVYAEEPRRLRFFSGFSGRVPRGRPRAQTCPGVVVKTGAAGAQNLDLQAMD